MKKLFTITSLLLIGAIQNTQASEEKFHLNSIVYNEDSGQEYIGTFANGTYKIQPGRNFKATSALSLKPFCHTKIYHLFAKYKTIVHLNEAKYAQKDYLDPNNYTSSYYSSSKTPCSPMHIICGMTTEQIDQSHAALQAFYHLYQEQPELFTDL